MIGLEFEMKGVGCLPDLSIRADGITVIAGLNGTGKSTILKALYCVLRPGSDLEELRQRSIRNILEYIWFRHGNSPSDLDQMDPVRVIEVLMGQGARGASDKESLDYVKELLDRVDDTGFYASMVRSQIKNEFIDLSQFGAVRGRDGAPAVVSCDGTTTVTVGRDGSVSVDGEIPRPTRAVYWDSPFNIDPDARLLMDNHRHALRDLLNANGELDPALEPKFSANLERFDSAVAGAVPGRLVNTDRGLRYASPDGDLFEIVNVAAGVKVFAILRMLVDKGIVRKGSVLMLDEPEVHLHPAWTGVLAEALAILAGDMGVKVIMTTHSPVLLRFVQAYSNKGGVVTDYYYLDRDEDGKVAVHDLGNNPMTIYGPMSDAFALAQNLYYGDGSE